MKSRLRLYALLAFLPITMLIGCFYPPILNPLFGPDVKRPQKKRRRKTYD
jgi:hypothetical protein